MSLTVEELIAKSKEQRGRKRYEEALVSALAAVEQDDEVSDAWWQVALCRQALGDAKNAIVALEKTVELSPNASNAWARLGDLHLKAGEKADAKYAFEMTLIFDEEQTTALEGMSRILAEENDKSQDEEEISILERIERVSSLSSFQINRFGILHYRNGRDYEAIRCWKMEISQAGHPSQRHNLGLAYNRDSVSQDADAIDMWRLTLRNWADYEPSKKSIATVLPRLLELAEKARRQAATLLPKEQWFDHYMNPFQLLNPPEEADLDALDAKALQKLKKSLLQEIDLEDGAVSWMPGIRIDKSRAIGLCDELNNEQKKNWHWHVYSNKPLLEFLTKGTHEHFLVGAELSELDTIDRIERDEDFLAWLGKLFAPQFDRVLTKAIDQGNTVITECLLDGRRWIPKSMEEDCFRNAQRTVEKLVKPLHDLWEGSEKNKPTVKAVESILERGGLLQIMNLLPAFFEKFQNDAVHSVRGLAVNAFNYHDDIDLSRQIIELARRFKFRSAAANRTIEEDAKTIEDLISKERKNEAKLTSGGSRWEITKEGVRHGDKFIAASEVSSIRWGAVITVEDTGKAWDFLVGFSADDGRRITFQWKASQQTLDKQQKFFENLISATMNYVFPPLLVKVQERLARGGSVDIGPCRVTSHGVHYEVKGWIFTSPHFTPWRSAQSALENGEVFIIDVNDRKKRVSFSLRDTDNAPLLRILVKINNGRDD